MPGRKNGHPGRRVRISESFPAPEPITQQRGPKGRYPFIRLEVGQSFNFLGDVRSAHALCAYYNKKTGHKFVARKTEKGPRCWRIA